MKIILSLFFDSGPSVFLFESHFLTVEHKMKIAN